MQKQTRQVPCLEVGDGERLTHHANNPSIAIIQSLNSKRLQLAVGAATHHFSNLAFCKEGG